jgi:hypothetical protein
MPRDYGSFFERIQEEFDVEELTKEKVQSFVKASPQFPKRVALVEEFLTNIYATLLSKVEKERVVPTIRKKLTIKQSNKQKSYTRNQGAVWTPLEINFAKRLKKDGLNNKQIGIYLNRSYSSIATKLSRVG